MPAAHQWIVSQIGPRQHYGVPRGFQIAGQLKHLYTDAWCPRWLRPLLLRGNPSMRGLASRRHDDIPSAKVTAHNLRAIRDGLPRPKNWTPRQGYLEYLRVGDEFDAAVAADLCRHGRLEPGRDAFFGFNTASLKTLTELRARGIPTVLDQIDPAKVEEDLILAESAKWPGWQTQADRIPQEYWDRMSAEWAAASVVIVNSNWSKAALLQQGVPPEKIRVVPVAYEPEAHDVPLRPRKEGPLTVLWLGTVVLRKGIQYLIEAAKLLRDTPMKFIVAGGIEITPHALSTAPPSVTFLGRITRDQIRRVYAEADIFVLPTLSDGFGGTQLEAMSLGLPVITTPNCGQVVTTGVDGLIVPAADAAALAAALANLNADRNLLAEMSINALAAARQFSLAGQTAQIEAAVAPA